MKLLFLCSEQDINNYNHNLVKNFLKLQKEDITLVSEKITTDFVKKFDFIISYSYRYIIKQEIIDLFKNNNIINLHISFYLIIVDRTQIYGVY